MTRAVVKLLGPAAFFRGFEHAQEKFGHRLPLSAPCSREITEAEISYRAR
jgi:hypothetical protein